MEKLNRCIPHEMQYSVKKGCKQSENVPVFCRYRLYSAWDFRDKVNPSVRNCRPRPPGQPDKRESWLKERYRVKINEAWYMDKAKYCFFTHNEFVDTFLREKENE